MDRRRRRERRYLGILLAAQVAASGSVDRPSHCSRGICHRFFRRRKLRVAANRLCLWQRALPLSFHQFVLHFIISFASLTMIAHVMLIDKKLHPALGAIELLNVLRPYASGLVLACVAVCLWDAVAVRLTLFQSRRYRWLEPVSLSPGTVAEEV